MTNNTSILAGLRLALFLAAAGLPLATGCKSAASCDAVVKKTVDTMVAAQGTDSMLKTDHIPKLVESCEASKALESHAETASCVMAAADFAALKDCSGFNDMMKAIMKGK